VNDAPGMKNDRQIVDELKRIVRLLAVVATQGQKQKGQIASLWRAGFEPKEIAELLGTTSNTVRVALVGIRKETKRGKSRQSQKPATDDKQEA